jgi:cytochrome bd ubiquinol oxidase subunit I
VKNGTNVVDVSVPPILSVLATGSVDGTVQGINDLQRRYEQQFGPGDYVPNVAVLYWAFRLMMGFGLAAVGVGIVGLWLTRKGREPARWTLWVSILGLPAAMAANIFGWVLTEIGRQPWTVFGELLTAASVSPGVSLAEVAISLTAFTLVYGVLAVIEGRLLWRYVKAGPAHVTPEPDAESVPSFAY